MTGCRSTMQILHHKYTHNVDIVTVLVLFSAVLVLFSALSMFSGDF